LCSLVIAGAFIYWGVNSLLESLWWGALLIFIGLSICSSQIYALMNRGKLRNIVQHEFEQNPSTTIEEITERTGFSKKDVKAIILDLKADGKLRGIFSARTGQMEMVTPSESESTPEITKGQLFCPNCGTRIDDREAKFCQYCGTGI
jgi:hypothetical protein